MTTSPSAEPAHRWAAFGASVRGPAHEREGRPNQDAVACLVGDSGGWAIAAVADGHGHLLAVRADVGSRLAVAAAVNEALRLRDDEDPERFSAQALGEALTHTWRESVLADLASKPLSDSELERSGNAETLETHPESAFGTTVVVTLAVGDRVLACQVGDGDIVVVDSGGGVAHPVPPDMRLIGTKTTSLASPSALDDLRIARLDLARTNVEAVVVATDGYVNSFSADDGFAAAARDLWKLLGDIGPEAVQAELEGWLASTSAEGTGDDASLVLLYDEARLSPRFQRTLP